MNENVVRSLSGLVYILLLVFATLYSQTSFLILFGSFLLQTSIEFSNLVSLPKIISTTIALIIYTGATLLPKNNYIEFTMLILSIASSINLIFWLFNTKNIPLNNKTKWINLIGYIIFPFVFFTKIVIINNIFIPSIIISIFILIWTNDTFAYIVGKSIGKKKLFEVISPKKTVEGFIGGFIFSILASYFIARYYVNMKIMTWAFIAIILSFFGTIGDLIESKFKRIAQVKDSGSIMPGHGGLLDRLDSIIFVSPFLFLFFKILEYVS